MNIKFTLFLNQTYRKQRIISIHNTLKHKVIVSYKLLLKSTICTITRSMTAATTSKLSSFMAIDLAIGEKGSQTNALIRWIAKIVKDIQQCRSK